MTVTFKQFLAEEREYWSDYPGQPGGKQFAVGLKNDIAETFKLSPRNISVKQYLPQVGKYAQKWSITLPKKFDGNQELFKSMLIKYMVKNLTPYFEKVEVHDSWVLADGSGLVVYLHLTHKWK